MVNYSTWNFFFWWAKTNPLQSTNRPLAENEYKFPKNAQAVNNAVALQKRADEIKAAQALKDKQTREAFTANALAKQQASTPSFVSMQSNGVYTPLGQKIIPTATKPVVVPVVQPNVEQPLPEKSRSTWSIALDNIAWWVNNTINKTTKLAKDAYWVTGYALSKVVQVPVDIIWATQVGYYKTLYDNAKTQWEKDNITKSINSVYWTKNSTDDFLKSFYLKSWTKDPKANATTAPANKSLWLTPTKNKEPDTVAPTPTSNSTKNETVDNQITNNLVDQGKLPEAQRENVPQATVTDAFKKPWNSPERMALAASFGITNYTGTPAQNAMMKWGTAQSTATQTPLIEKTNTPEPLEQDKDKEVSQKPISAATGRESVDTSNINLPKGPTVNEGPLNVNSSYTNTNYDELNKTGKNYQWVVSDRASKLSDEVFDAAWKQTAIEKEASEEKIERSDLTREELLEVTGDFKDKQDDRYQEVDDITQRQKNIANRQAQMAAASAWQYGDIYSDGAMANIKNDVIAKYGENILNAEQYALNTNRTIDNDLLNVWLKEIEDKDKRDAFKDLLLDKENAYMLNAIAEASEGNKQAIKDVSAFYEWYIKQKADFEATRAGMTELRAWLESEYDSVDAFGKAALIRDLSKDIAWYSIVADRIPGLINKYPDATVSEIQGKLSKIGELALTAKQQLPTIVAKEEKDRTQVEKDILQMYGDRGLEEARNSDRSTSETIAQQRASEKNEVKEGPTIYDNTPEGKKVLDTNKDYVKQRNEATRQKIAEAQAQLEQNKEIARLDSMNKENLKKRQDAYKKLDEMAAREWFQNDKNKIARLRTWIEKNLPLT